MSSFFSGEHGTFLTRSAFRVVFEGKSGVQIDIAVARLAPPLAPYSFGNRKQ